MIRKLSNARINSTNKHRVYITTNEVGTSAIASLLTSTPSVPNSCHIGFSGWHNFDIMALRRSSRGVIIDRNPENTLFLHATLEVLRHSANREEFVSNMIDYVTRHKPRKPWLQGADLKFSVTFSINIRLTDLPSPADEINAHVREKCGWLADENRFQHIKRLAETDQIALVTEDCRATKKFEALRQLLRDNGAQVDSLYISNIGSYMLTAADHDSFLQTIRLLSDADTFVVDACLSHDEELSQRVIHPKSLPSTSEQVNWWLTQGSAATTQQRPKL